MGISFGARAEPELRNRHTDGTRNKTTARNKTRASQPDRNHATDGARNKTTARNKTRAS